MTLLVKNGDTNEVGFHSICPCLHFLYSLCPGVPKGSDKDIGVSDGGV